MCRIRQNMDLDHFADRSLWDHLDDVSYWIKDRDGRFVWVNLTLASQAQAPREAMLGTKDSDWFYNELADVYMGDDWLVVSQGRSFRNKPELVMSPDGVVVWHLTSKFPHHESGGRVAGSFGMSRPMESMGGLPSEYVDLSEIVAYARKNLGESIGVGELAEAAGMSVSTLERTVRHHLRLTPQELLRRIRMNRARHLVINTSLKVGEVALQCGYESFSAFCRAFRKAHGCRPGALREQD